MAGPQIPKDFRRVIVAAAVGNVIEWYDFYIFGSLAAVLSVKFFEQSHPVAALLSTIALFTAGFLIRPLGAFLFGWMGDRVGRKYTFLITLSGMGLGTGAIGLIPTYESIGLSAAFILFGLRMIQGLCLGGEYGGAITYVAEHVSDERRGYYTGWLQTSPTLGIVVSLFVIIATRTYFGNEVFDAWAWRIPFLISFLLVAIAIYIRLQLQETPIFEEIKAKGQMTKNPWKEAFLSSNIKFVLIATRRADRAGSGLVQRSVLGVVLPAAGFQGGPADYGLHRGSRAAPRDAELDLFWLAVRHHRPQTGDLGRHVARGDHLLSAVFVAGNRHAAWQHQLSDRDLHHLHPRLLRGDGLWAGRGVPGGILPRQDSLHVGVCAVSHRQRLGWRIGAVHHLGGFRGHRQHRLRADLSDRGSGGVFRARPLPDAGNSPYQHLG